MKNDDDRRMAGDLLLPPELRRVVAEAGPDHSPALLDEGSLAPCRQVGDISDISGRRSPPGTLEGTAVPTVYLCGDTSEVHRWGVDLDEDDFYKQVAQLQILVQLEVIHHVVIGVRRTNFFRLSSILNLIFRIRGLDDHEEDDVTPLDLVNIRIRFHSHMTQLNQRYMRAGIELRLIDPKLYDLLGILEQRARQVRGDAQDLLRALGPVCKTAFCGPRSMLLDLEGRCNVDCVYCGPFSPLAPARPDEEELISRRLLLQDLALPIAEAKAMGVEQVIISGHGEPTLYPDLMSLLEQIVEAGMAFSIVTNGARLHLIQDLVLGGGCESVTVNLSAASDETFALLRPGTPPRLRERAERTLSELAAAKKAQGSDRPRLTALYVICKLNVHELPDMVRHAAGLGVDGIQLRPVVSPGFGEDELQIDSGDRAAAQELLDEARELCNEFGLRWSSAAGRGEDGGELLARGCHVGWRLIHVQARGAVGVCCEDSAAGFLDPDGRGLTEAWGSKLFQRHRDDGLILHRENPLDLLGRPLYQPRCDACDAHGDHRAMREDLARFALEPFVERG